MVKKRAKKKSAPKKVAPKKATVINVEAPSKENLEKFRKDWKKIVEAPEKAAPIKDAPKLDPQYLLDQLVFHNVDFPESQYMKTSYPKKQIFLHHTVSGEGVDGDLSHWLNTSARIATCIIVDRKGEVYQCFSSRYWAHHLGVKVDVFKGNKIPMKTRTNSSGKSYYANNEILNQESIGVELDSWGWLERKGDQWFSYTGREVSSLDVQVYTDGYRGQFYYERYTDAQIKTLKILLQYWNIVYDIPLCDNSDMWDVSKSALSGASGIWSHTSVRSDKSDIHPQPELIKMLKTLH